MFSQFDLHLQHLQVATLDAVGTADEVFVTIEQVQVLLLHSDAVVCTLHLIIRLHWPHSTAAPSEAGENREARNREEENRSAREMEGYVWRLWLGRADQRWR